MAKDITYISNGKQYTVRVDDDYDINNLEADLATMTDSAPQRTATFTPDLPAQPFDPQTIMRDPKAAAVAKNAIDTSPAAKELENTGRAVKTAGVMAGGSLGARAGQALMQRMAPQVANSGSWLTQMLAGTLGEGAGAVAGTKAAQAAAGEKPTVGALDYLSMLIPGLFRVAGTRNLQSGITKSNQMGEALTGEPDLRGAIASETTAPRASLPLPEEIAQAESAAEKAANAATQNATARQAATLGKKQANTANIQSAEQKLEGVRTKVAQTKATDVGMLQLREKQLLAAKMRLGQALDKLDESKLGTNDELREALATAKTPEEKTQAFLEFMKAKSRGGKYDKNYFEKFMDPADVDELYAAREMRRDAVKALRDAKNTSRANAAQGALDTRQTGAALGSVRRSAKAQDIADTIADQAAAAADKANVQSAQGSLNSMKRLTSLSETSTQPNAVAGSILQSVYNGKNNAFDYEKLDRLLADKGKMDFLRQHYNDPHIQEKLSALLPAIEKLTNKVTFLKRVGASATAAGVMSLAASSRTHDPTALLAAGGLGLATGAIPTLLDKGLRNPQIRQFLINASKMGKLGGSTQALIEALFNPGTEKAIANAKR